MLTQFFDFYKNTIDIHFFSYKSITMLVLVSKSTTLSKLIVFPNNLALQLMLSLEL